MSGNGGGPGSGLWTPVLEGLDSKVLVTKEPMALCSSVNPGVLVKPSQTRTSCPMLVFSTV